MALDPQRQIKRIRGSVPARKKRGDNAQDVKLYDALRIPRATKERLDELKEKLEAAIFTTPADTSKDSAWYDRHLRYEEFLELLYLAASRTYRRYLINTEQVGEVDPSDSAPASDLEETTAIDTSASEADPEEQSHPEAATVSQSATKDITPAKRSKQKAKKEPTEDYQVIGDLFED